MALLDLAHVGVRAVRLAARVHVVEALLGTLLRLIRVVGVGDGSLCRERYHVSRIRRYGDEEALTEATSNLQGRVRNVSNQTTARNLRFRGQTC